MGDSPTGLFLSQPCGAAAPVFEQDNENPYREEQGTGRARKTRPVRGCGGAASQQQTQPTLPARANPAERAFGWLGESLMTHPNENSGSRRLSLVVLVV